MTPNPGWTDDRVEVLKAAWLEGQSCAQIARKLGHVSRNAVIGKISRLGLSGKSGQVRAKPSAPAGQKHSYAKGPEERDRSNHALRIQAQLVLIANPAPEPPAMGSQVVTPNAKTVMHLVARDCRFPVGGGVGAEQLHCGEPKDGCGPYCAGHKALAFVPPARDPRRYERIGKWLASK